MLAPLVLALVLVLVLVTVMVVVLLLPRRPARPLERKVSESKMDFSHLRGRRESGIKNGPYSENRSFFWSDRVEKHLLGILKVPSVVIGQDGPPLF